MVSGLVMGTRAPRVRRVLAVLTAILVVGWGLSVVGARPARAAGVPSGFTDSVVLSGLQLPTNVAFARDGRIFVTEKSGLVKVFSGLGDSTADVVADLRTETFNFSDAGMNGLVVDPQWPTRPYIYVTYVRDAALGGTPPRYGTPGATDDNCPVANEDCVTSGALVRLTLNPTTARMTGMKFLLNQMCFDHNAHAIDEVRFGPEGALYVSGGDGGTAGGGPDYGQRRNLCGDPPSPAGTSLSPTTSQGGALRAQDLLTSGDPLGLNGTISRINPDTGLGWPTNPLASSSDANARRVLAHGLRNPFRFNFRPGSKEVYIGDVGWKTWEELDVVRNVDDAVVENFGWPCYEGVPRQPGYDSLNNVLCEGLYSRGGVTPPLYTYNQAAKFLPNGDCPSLTAGAVGGVAFYTGTSYPAAYRGAMFFVDYTRSCMLVMRAGTDGRPVVSTLAEFSSRVPNPVDLEVGPGGDLFYVDIVGGTVHRIHFSAGGNTPPTAAITASASGGPVGTTLTFSGSRSRDPDGDALRYAWDLDGDGAFDDATGVTITHRYASRGSFPVRLRVSDPQGASGVAGITVNIGQSPPRPAIGVVGSALWRTGGVLTLTGSATDPDQGSLPAGRLSWKVTLQHCEPGTSTCHAHPLSGASGTSTFRVTGPDHPYPSFLDVTLTATDSTGLTGRVTRRFAPATTKVTVASSPTGMKVDLDGDLVTAPVTRTEIVGSTVSLSAPASQTLGGRLYGGPRWSDGGAAAHDLKAPATPITVTATFRLAGTTATSLRSSARALTYGQSTRLFAHVVSGSSPVRGERVQFFGRWLGGRWTALGSPVATDANGNVSIPHRPTRTTEFVAVHNATATHLRSVSRIVRVPLRPAATLLTARTSAVLGVSTALRGHLTPALGAQPVALQRFTSSGWITTANTRTSSTGNFGFNVSPRTLGAWQYRVFTRTTASLAGRVVATVRLERHRAVLVGVHPNAAGDDRANLNDEYVLARNVGPLAINLGAWALDTGGGRRVALPAYRLAAGATVRINTGRGAATASRLFLGRTSPLWPDTAGVGLLLDRNRSLVSRISYGG